MGSIFGKKKSSSTQESGNKAYEPVQQAYQPMLAQAQNGANAYQQFLSGDTSGFNKYKENTGYNLDESQGIQDIMSGAAAKGVFTSGATGKALQRFGTGLNQQYSKDYLNSLLGQANLGFQAGTGMTQAGSWSKGNASSEEKPGIGGLVGTIASSGALGAGGMFTKMLH